MGTTQMNIRIDEDLRRSADSVSSALGITTSSAINVFLRQYVAHDGFPFPVRSGRRKGLRFNPDDVLKPAVAHDGAPILPSEWNDEEDDAYAGLL